MIKTQKNYTSVQSPNYMHATFSKGYSFPKEPAKICVRNLQIISYACRTDLRRIRTQEKKRKEECSTLKSNLPK